MQGSVQSSIEELSLRAYRVEAEAGRRGSGDIAETARWLQGFLEGILELWQRYGWSREIGEMLSTAERILGLLERRLGQT